MAPFKVHKIQPQWALEYGMPSTHAMIGISVPASVIIFTMNRYMILRTIFGIRIAAKY